MLKLFSLHSSLSLEGFLKQIMETVSSYLLMEQKKIVPIFIKLTHYDFLLLN